MSFSDELFDKQFYLARAIMNCNDPIEVKKLFDEYILYAGQWDELFSTRKATNRLEAIHFVFSFFWNYQELQMKLLRRVLELHQQLSLLQES